MTFGFAPPMNVSRPASADSVARLGRMLEPSEWASAGIPLLRNPREIVTGLHDRHRPGPSTAIVAVLDPLERVAASASFTEPAALPDGWEFRNVLLAHLRRVIPHDLRLRAPVRTAVLLYCREGEPRWTEADGAWMWGLRDACTLHGLRCGAYITLTPDRWQVLGEDRGGRPPRASRRTDQVSRRTGRLSRRAESVSRRTDPASRQAAPASSRTEPSRARAPRAMSPRTAAADVALPLMPSPRTPPAEALPAAESPSRTGKPAMPRRSGGGAREAQRHTAAR